ncbi:glycosyl transferase family 2 [Sulfolobus sp. A20]|uniref:glycosyltransferase n=1 Tax=Sulfolobaceae TaxID=118883 RepID=UPI000845CD5A|nr:MULTISPECIES: glycosyltransferase family 2 protein [unclassified Sulfolobus]TRM74852.1 glycosyl transferase family 2 [Sulfolobus sp. E5]TRM79174.1 glycosyl transferase family 2 [Sulfolobus sp. B5]TRM81764.1 glycosyl transferase family 2 [Sulfolobus sp. D5]TRM84748.1 glycosyl transferase family 2 [Sulfolobus sp. F3]TRM87971.1 glycosyl transferase family 2 [Sulfolobus sp. E3]TRM89276.1 glycosyl transferase family 2 [Sulfolobus sp. C3]TRM98861.1 glycosyl transferase family 2 [Sulfolobus sp. 
MVKIIIPVGPSDNLDWVKKSVFSAISQPVDGVIVYDNSERRDINEFFESLKDKIIYVKDERMKKVNMAKLRNKMLKLANDKYIIMLDSDVVIPKDYSKRLIDKLEKGVVFTWMHYAYSEDEVDKHLSVNEHNPNLGCSGLNREVIKEFDERYERDEDVWLYAKLKKSGYIVEPADGRCLHLNKVHARLDFSSSIKEARRNLWRSKYDIMLMFDGLIDFTFLTGYAYYGSYYILGLLSGLIFPPLAVLYIPLIGYGIRYYGGVRKFLLNLIPGLALALSSPYGLWYNLVNKRK